MKLSEILLQAIDMHVHIGPEVIPRKFTAQTLAQQEARKLRGCVLKNHFYPTAGMFDSAVTTDLELYGSIVLNNSVGGLNPDAVYAASLVSKGPLIVWLPTINAVQFLATNGYEVAPEWVADKSLKLRPAAEVVPVEVTRNNRLLAQTKRLIQMIARVKGVLATGHIGFDESRLVAAYARSLGVPVIITHPIYQHIAMPITVQKELALLGCYLEQSYSMFSMDGIPITKIATQIKRVGPESIILSSDVGQPFSPDPSQALEIFAKLLVTEGIPLQWIKIMMVENPRKILKITKETT